MRYRKKPVVVEAFRWGVDPVPEWFDNNGLGIDRATGSILIETPEGMMEARVGHYIIKEPFDKARNIYPCKPDIFEQTYEIAEDGW